jgi:DNA-binding response OmpR family regulator
MDLSAHQFTIDDAELHLTNTEYQFLQLLMENPHRILTRGQILEAIEDRLKLAQINKLESDSAKSRQQVMESIQNMYGVNQTQQNP